VLHAGQLQQVGTKEEIIRNPATNFVRELLKGLDLLEERK
jgi:ABC-type proline/glycine betaine transport system ATPase subunit